MNQLAYLPTATMNHFEISDLVDKRPDNVKRTIETLADNGVIRLPQIEVFEKINNLGFTIKVNTYVFTGEQGKRDSIIVVAQLCPEFTARLVDRWQELENQPKQHNIDLNNPHALRNEVSLIDAFEQIEAQKIEAFRLSNKCDSISEAIRLSNSSASISGVASDSISEASIDILYIYLPIYNLSRFAQKPLETH